MTYNFEYLPHNISFSKYESLSLYGVVYNFPADRTVYTGFFSKYKIFKQKFKCFN
jgi:hypothetical protein